VIAAGCADADGRLMVVRGQVAAYANSARAAQLAIVEYKQV
jgi:hypothetical protein